MDLISGFQDARNKLLERSSSPEYQAACQHYQSEFYRLAEIALSFLQENAETIDLHEPMAVCREYASGSTLHRGFYCPCPVIEIIVGNTHRGKLLKRLTPRSRPTHEYGFGADGKLHWSKQLNNGNMAHIEHLLYDGNLIHGITIDSSNRLSTITEEVYDNKRISRYTNCLCVQSGNSLRCVELNSYEYFYDAQGLYQYVWHRYMNPSNSVSIHTPESTNTLLSEMHTVAASIPPMYNRSEYTFNRKSGYIVSFSNNKFTYIPRKVIKA